MPTKLESVVTKYLRSGSPAQRTREEYATTLRKWARWSGAVPLESLGRKEIREFLDWVYENAASREGSNPGRTTNKVRSHLRAALSWAWEHDLLDSLPRFPRHKPQRDVAGKHYLTKSEINALYFATHQMRRLASIVSARGLSAGFLPARSHDTLSSASAATHFSKFNA
jgi:site-specific recombinase XerD